MSGYFCCSGARRIICLLILSGGPSMLKHMREGEININLLKLFSNLIKTQFLFYADIQFHIKASLYSILCFTMSIK